MTPVVARIPDSAVLREPGCMSCVVDAMEWGWGEQSCLITKIITYVVVFFVTVIAIFTLIGIPFVFCTIYEYASRNTAENVSKVVRDRITELTVANDKKQEKIAVKNTRIGELREVRDKRAKEITALNSQIKTLQQTVSALEVELKQAQEAPKGGTLKIADVQPFQQKIKSLQAEVDRLSQENATLTVEVNEKKGQQSLTQQGMAIATALMHLSRSIPKANKIDAIESAMQALAQGFTEQERSISSAWQLLQQAHAGSSKSHGQAIDTAIKILQGKRDELHPHEVPGHNSDSDDESPDLALDGKKPVGSDPGPSSAKAEHKESKMQAPRAPAKVPSSLIL